MDEPLQNVPPPETDLSGLTGDPSGMAGLQQTPPMPDEMQQAVPPPVPETQGMDNGQLQSSPQPNLSQLPPRPPGTSIGAQPIDKKQFFREMLSNFLYSMGQGLSQSGTGPGANARGAGAALTAIPQREMMQKQLAIQQEQANAARLYKEAQAQSLTPSISMIDPTGNTVMVPPAHVGQALAAQYRLAGTQAAVQGRKDVANIVTGEKGKEAAAKLNPTTKVLQDAAAAFEKGDMDTYKSKLAEAQQLSSATAKPGKDTEITLIQKALAGDKDAASAYKQLQAGRVQVRAASATMRSMNFYDPTLQRNVTMSAQEAESRQKNGESLIPAGQVPANTILQMQRAQSAIPAAVDEVAKSAEAWDNPQDRAIFAKVLKDSPMDSAHLDSWFGNVLNQVATGNLSPKGRDAVVKLRRLNESMGTLRAISGLPSTTGSMAATAALLPGPTTPDSAMAKEQLNQIKTLVQQETGVPFMGNTKPSAPSGKGALSLDEAKQYLQLAGGDKNKARALAKKDGRTF